MIWRIVLLALALSAAFSATRKAIGNYHPADLIQLKTVEGSTKVLYIFEGMVSPPIEAGFRQFADAYDGDVYFVEYGHDGCAIDLYCQKVYYHAFSKNYDRVDILGISIGAETYAAFFAQNAVRCHRLNIRFWAVCPFSPGVAFDNVRAGAKAITLVLSIVELALGFIGQIRFIRWDGVWRSFSEIVEQGFIAAWGRPLFPLTFRMHDGLSYRVMVNPDYASTKSKGILWGIVLAHDDEFVDRAKVLKGYQSYTLNGRQFHTPIAYVDGKHCRLTETDAYVTALRDLGLFK